MTLYRTAVRTHLPLIGRIVSLLAFAAAGTMYVKAWPIAFDAYNAVCPPGDRIFTPGNRELFQSELIEQTMMSVGVFALPVLLARSRIAVGANFVAAVLVLLLSLGLSHSAATPPYQCATSFGSYEDHSSGIPEFELFAMLLLLLIYLTAVVDLLVWLGRWSWPMLKRVAGHPDGPAPDAGRDTANRRLSDPERIAAGRIEMHGQT